MVNIFKNWGNIKNIERDVDGKSDFSIREKQKALEISIKEGSVSQFSSGIGESYITPFALALKANSWHVGLLSSLSGLANPLSQLIGSQMMENNSRKKIVRRFVLLQAFIWIPIIFLCFLFWKGLFVQYLPYALIVLFTLLVSCQGIMHPPGFSWMGDLVPEKDRGKYFSIKNRVNGTISLIGFLLGAIILDFFKTKGLAILGFGIIFSIATSFRIYSFLILKKIYSPKFKVKKESYFSFRDFLKRFDNYGKFALYQALFNFSLMIASPFFAVYMLQELKFSYTLLMAVIISGSIFHIVLSPIIGRFSDRFGNLRLIHLATFLFAINPLLWMFIKDPLFLIIIPQFLSGLANASFTIGTTNFTYDSVSPQKRGICVAYTSIMSGVGVFFGSLLGGLLLNYVDFNLVNPFIVTFAIASITRFLVGLFALPLIKEEKKVERLPPAHINLTHPFKSIHSEIGFFRNILKNKNI